MRRLVQSLLGRIQLAKGEHPQGSRRRDSRCRSRSQPHQCLRTISPETNECVPEADAGSIQWIPGGSPQFPHHNVAEICEEWQSTQASAQSEDTCSCGLAAAEKRRDDWHGYEHCYEITDYHNQDREAQRTTHQVGKIASPELRDVEVPRNRENRK